MRGLIITTLPYALSALSTAVIWRGGVFTLSSKGYLIESGFFSLASYPVQALSTVPALTAPLLLVKNGPYASQARKILNQILRPRNFRGHGPITGHPSTVAHRSSSGGRPSSMADGYDLVLCYCCNIPCCNNGKYSLRSNGKAWLPSVAQVAGALVGSITSIGLVDRFRENSIAVGVLVSEVLILSVIGVFMSFYGTRTRMPLVKS